MMKHFDVQSINSKNIQPIDDQLLKQDDITFLKIVNVDIKLYFINIKNITLEEIFQKYSQDIKQEDIDKMNEFKLALNQKQSIVSSILKNKYVPSQIYYNEYGKPLNDDLFFNVSHSNEYVVMAISKKYSVGIDIEHIKKDVSDDLINYVCCEEEVEAIKTSERNKLFYVLWTRKEAILKCKGIGIVHNLKDLLKDNEIYSLYSYLIDDYVCSLAVDVKNTK